MQTPTDRSFRRMAAAGALSAGLAVALGAFGAHALRGRLTSEMLAVYDTAARYQMYHALGLLTAAMAPLAAGANPLRAWRACLGFACGTLLFSGSLYALALTGAAALGAITPLGGLAFIAGWALLGASFIGSAQRG